METPMEFANRWNSTFCKEGETTVEMLARMVAERDEAVREEAMSRLGDAQRETRCERQRRIDETARAIFVRDIAAEHPAANATEAVAILSRNALRYAEAHEAERERRLKEGTP